MAESYYYPILSQIGSLGARGVAFQHFKNATAWFLDPMKQEIKHEETMIYEMYANDSSREAAFFFLRSWVKQLQRLSKQKPHHWE